MVGMGNSRIKIKENHFPISTYVTKEQDIVRSCTYVGLYGFNFIPAVTHSDHVCILFGF